MPPKLSARAAAEMMSELKLQAGGERHAHEVIILYPPIISPSVLNAAAPADADSTPLKE